MNAPIRILIADDHALIREGIKKVLEANTEYLVDEAKDGEEALTLYEQNNYDVIILDFEMPKLNGFEVSKRMLGENQELNIVILTMFRQESLFNKAIDLGVKGYLTKENTVTEIVACVEKVLGGGHYISPSISELIIQRNRKKKLAGHLDLDSSLTSTESTVMNLLAEMKTNQEIADELGVSIKTIQNHRNNVCKKLGLNGTHALLKYAVQNAPFVG
ncbi:MAG: response regulator transcription factor [Balneolales bacterium]|nr:response regulator transcription factor [Balneolales bacterium]